MIPFLLKKFELVMLPALYELTEDSKILSELWWQSSISKNGVNEKLCM